MGNRVLALVFDEPRSRIGQGRMYQRIARGGLLFSTQGRACKGRRSGTRLWPRQAIIRQTQEHHVPGSLLQVVDTSIARRGINK